MRIITEQVSSGDSQDPADFRKWRHIENYSFLLKSVGALAAPDFSIMCARVKDDL